MRIIHKGGFTKEERRQWRVIIFGNLVNAFQILFASMDEQETDFEDEENFVRHALRPRKTSAYVSQHWAQLILSNPDIHQNEPLPVEYLTAFNNLWQDRGIQLAMLKGNEYALHDNLS